MRTMSKTLTWKPIPLFRRSSTTAMRSRLRSVSHSDDYINFKGINKMLPKNIHILTLEPWDNHFILLRLEHFYEINEDSEQSTPTDVSLRNLFTTFRIIYVKEMTLSANQELTESERKRMVWTPDFDPYANYKSAFGKIDDSINENLTYIENNSNQTFLITLEPMQIRTFLIKFDFRLNCPYTGFNVPQRQQTKFNNGLDC